MYQQLPLMQEASMQHMSTTLHTM